MLIEMFVIVLLSLLLLLLLSLLIVLLLLLMLFWLLYHLVRQLLIIGIECAEVYVVIINLYIIWHYRFLSDLELLMIVVRDHCSCLLWPKRWQMLLLSLVVASVVQVSIRLAHDSGVIVIVDVHVVHVLWQVHFLSAACGAVLLYSFLSYFNSSYLLFRLRKRIWPQSVRSGQVSVDLAVVVLLVLQVALHRPRWRLVHQARRGQEVAFFFKGCGR